MGIASSLFAKPVGKALAKSAIKQTDQIAPKIAADIVDSIVADAPLPSASLAGRKSKKAAPESVTKQEPLPPVEENADIQVNTDPLFKYEEPVDVGVPDNSFVPSKTDRVEDFGIEPELIADSGTDAFKALDLSADKKEAWRKENKASQRSRLLPEIEEAAQKLFEGKLKPEEFRKLSAEKQPIVPLDKVPDMPSFKDIAGALTEAQVNKGIVGLNMKIPKGERVSSRLDIPAYNDYNTWVVSLHEGSTKSGAPIGYAKTAVLQNVEFVSDPKVALDIARRKPLGSGGRMGKATIARIFGDYVPHNPDSAKAYAEKIFNDPEWTQVGMNPYRASYFYDKADNMPVVSADEIVQIGPLVMAKNVKKTNPDDALFKVNKKDDASPTFAKGGAVKNEMNKLFAEGGVMQEGGTVDPVSGNDVPPGAMQEEVRDDIDAKLSEGEFVFPADVVRYVGLETLMKIRDKAKMGLKKMEEIGQMGNAEEVPDGEALHGSEEMDDETFSSEIDSILSEDGGDEDRGYAAGGYVGGTANEKLYKDAPLKGFEMVAMTNSSGNIVYIPFINGQPQLSVPAGYSVKKEGAVDNKAPDTTTGITTNDGINTTTGLYQQNTGGDSTAGPSDSSNVGFTIGPDGFAVANETNPAVASAIGSVVGAVVGLPGLGMVGKSLAEQSNFMNSQQTMAFNVAVNENTNPANINMNDTVATPGPEGTGAAAAAAGISAANAATAAGLSPAAIGAAQQSAVNDTLNGLTPSQVAENANAAAVSIGISEANMDAANNTSSVAADTGPAAVGNDAGVGDAPPGGGEAPSVGDGTYAKGGFVSKKKTSKPTSLVSRRK